MDWLTVFQNIGIFGVGTGILAILIKSLVSASLNKDLETYKSNLNKELEAFRGNLQIATIEHQVRFTKLHSERAEVIKKLYQKLALLDTAIHSVLKRFQKVGEADLEDKVREYSKLHNELNEFFLLNRIFFDDNVCKVIDNLLFLSRDTYIDITTYPIDPTSAEYKYGPRELLSERHEYWEKARAVFEKDIKNLKEQLETQFREMLGVKSIHNAGRPAKEITSPEKSDA